MESKICPIAALGEERTHFPCLLQACAWFDMEHDCCGVLAKAHAEVSTAKAKTTKAKGSGV